MGAENASALEHSPVKGSGEGEHPHKRGAAANLRIKTEEDISQITHPEEQEFARFLLSTLSGNSGVPSERSGPRIIYEPGKFQCIDDSGRIRGTVPDFLVGKTYIEMTGSPRWALGDDGKVRDKKFHQKEIMEKAAHGRKFVVLYRSELVNLHNRHPEFIYIPPPSKPPSQQEGTV